MGVGQAPVRLCFQTLSPLGHDFQNANGPTLKIDPNAPLQRISYACCFCFLRFLSYAEAVSVWEGLNWSPVRM